ncbi:MAG: hypothetical protein ACYC7F_04140 [Gemmatimonadaceae bacterium]
MLVLSGCSLFDRITGTSDNCSGPTPFAAGSTITDTLGVRNCQGPTGTSGKVYTLTLTQETSLRVTANASAFTPLVSLYTADKKELSEPLNIGSLRVFLPAGSYELFIGRGSGKDGAFTLSSITAGLGGGCSSTTGTLSNADIGTATKGAVFDGTMTAADCGSANAKMHWYRIRLSSGDTLNASGTVDQAAGLSLLNPTGTAVFSKEVAAGGSWSTAYVAAEVGTVTLRIESRVDNAGIGLPLHYTVALR